jgi:hypothetical protein
MNGADDAPGPGREANSFVVWRRAVPDLAAPLGAQWSVSKARPVPPKFGMIHAGSTEFDPQGKYNSNDDSGIGKF